ncbi:hypothetical protein [Nitrincola iocasae]|uniref:Uncharacterized protein n=1 Tax=Nitrincola iocasae TaxID=2614693 RepID=A0A5J6LCM5_9GAMM|nr:hypothetical protein [Nitrincola iocasae]QEW06349.1 hypothetical protein F5I99_07435 [Nitrincola iocasae]
MSTLRKCLRSWYLRNSPFLAFCLVLVSLFFVIKTFCTETEPSLLIAGLTLQLLGILITFIGILDIRKEFNRPGFWELIKGLFRFKSRTVYGIGSGNLNMLAATVTASKAEPTTGSSKEDVNAENIYRLFNMVHEDRHQAQMLLEQLRNIEKRIDAEVLPKVGQISQQTERIHISGSGLTLMGLGWVAIGVICSAIPSFL